MTDKMVRTRVKNGLWEVALPRVFRLPGSVASWQQAVSAACLYSDGCASHACAARLHRLDGFDRARVEITTSRRVVPVRGVRFHLCRSKIERVCRIGGIPATDLVRTVLDVAGTEQIDAVELGLEDTLRRGVPIESYRREVAGPCHGIAGRAAVRRLLKDRPLDHVPMRSALEVQTLRTLLSAKLPRPVYEHPVPTRGGFTLHPDFSYPEDLIAMECQSFRHHSGRGAFDDDIDRRRFLRELGWTVVEVTSTWLRKDPQGFVAHIRKLLVMRNAL